MKFSAFARCGFLRFSSRNPLPQIIFEAMRDSHSGVWNDETFEGPMAGYWFASAMALARARGVLERAKNQADPLLVFDLLKVTLRHYGVVPPSGSTVNQMRALLSAAEQVSFGSMRTNVETQLAAALGDDFLGWRPWVNDGTNSSFPENPWLSVGIFSSLPVWRTITILDRVDMLGSRTVSWEYVSGEEGDLQIGDELVVAPGLLGQQERIVLTARTASTLTAVFARPHEEGATAIQRPWPFWLSNQCHSLIVVPNGRALVPEVRQRAHAIMSKLMGDVSTWDIAEENSMPGAAGPFVANQGQPNVTPIQSVTI